MNSLLKESLTFTSKTIPLNGGTEYHVPAYTFRNDYSQLLGFDGTEKQSYSMKIMTVDNKAYYVPDHWMDCEITRNMIREMCKRKNNL